MNGLGPVGAYFALFSEIGLVLLVTVLVGVLGGYWLDQQLRTVPIFALAGSSSASRWAPGRSTG